MDNDTLNYKLDIYRKSLFYKSYNKHIFVFVVLIFVGIVLFVEKSVMIVPLIFLVIISLLFIGLNIQRDLLMNKNKEELNSEINKRYFTLAKCCEVKNCTIETNLKRKDAKIIINNKPWEGLIIERPQLDEVEILCLDKDTPILFVSMMIARTLSVLKIDVL